MFHTPEYTHNVSLRLSKVLDDIGVNEETVRKRRKTFLTQESLNTLTERLRGRNVTIFNFGSQTEGTTTLALQPDTDILVCHNDFNIMQDIQEWEAGFTNLLMVQDKDTPPGYCLLQKTYEDCPLPVDDAPSNIFVRDAPGRVLMRNTWFADHLPDGCIRHGPSTTSLGEPGFADQDLVYAYHCKSWPVDASPWLHRKSAGDWPHHKMKQLAVSDGCFVVPVSSRENLDDEFQWRISTSLTERTLMFNLNITQIRCYVLMKMILKSYPNLQSENTLSSFMCKSILMHCIEKTPADFWQDQNLLSCLHDCLTMLYDCVSFEHCPHFMIPGNNLMRARISPEVKPMLCDIILYLIQSEGRALLEIDIDLLGNRLSTQFSTFSHPALNLYPSISGQLLHNFMLFLSARNADFLSELTYSSTEFTKHSLLHSIHKLAGIYTEDNEFQKIACKLIAKFMCTSLGSVIASYSISINKALPKDALIWFSTDLTEGISNRLKLASMFYCSGDIIKTEFILKDMENRYDLNTVLSVCGCWQNSRPQVNEDFRTKAALNDDETVVDSVAFCVRYVRTEINCIPEELQQELYRSDFDLLPSHRGVHDGWMDWAVVDSIPYFYFLLYKVYSRLGDPVKQQRALTNLARTIDRDKNLGHPETAINVLGQCLEQENRLHDALNCYTLSSNLRPTNNAASIYICQVKSKIDNQLLPDR